ncbi:hypothetical protein D3C81_2339450 [compost metagenome]
MVKPDQLRIKATSDPNGWVELKSVQRSLGVIGDGKVTLDCSLAAVKRAEQEAASLLGVPL